MKESQREREERRKSKRKVFVSFHLSLLFSVASSFLLNKERVRMLCILFLSLCVCVCVMRRERRKREENDLMTLPLYPSLSLSPPRFPLNLWRFHIGMGWNSDYCTDCAGSNGFQNENFIHHIAEYINSTGALPRFVSHTRWT
jgi:hypothetical protein